MSESMIRNTTRNQKLGWVLFIAYLALLVYFMFFAESFGRNPDLREYSYNLELFKEIRRFYKYRKQLGMEAFLLNIVGNVVYYSKTTYLFLIYWISNIYIWKEVKS